LKKIVIWILILAFVSTMALFGAGCKQQVAEETTAAETTAAATTVAETTAAETTASNELDPWIAKVWAEVDQYRHPIPAGFKGPNGETVTLDVDSLKLTTAEVEKVKAMNLKVGLPWHVLQGEYFTAWQKGTHDACEYLNMKIVAETDAGFDPAKQKSDIESMMPLKPDVLIAAPADVTTGAEAFRPAVDAGIKLSLISNIPLGYKKGVDYIGLSTSNCHDIGVFANETAKELLGEGGKIGLLIWAQEYWFANYADSIVVDNIADYGLEVVDNQGFISGDDAYNAATAMILKYPDIDGFYITYMTPAISVAAACIDAQRPDIKIITGSYDLPTLLNMAQGGNIQGITTDATYLVGVNSVLVAAYGFLGKEGPDYAVCPAIKMTLKNMREIWQIGMRTPIAPEVDEALKKAGY
jgi:ribose transport system substrate-binding protein